MDIRSVEDELVQSWATEALGWKRGKMRFKVKIKLNSSIKISIGSCGTIKTLKSKKTVSAIKSNSIMYTVIKLIGKKEGHI